MTPEPNVGADNITPGHLEGLTARIQQRQADLRASRREYAACWGRMQFNGLGLIFLSAARFVRKWVLPLLGYRWAVVALGTTLTWGAFALLSLSFIAGYFGAVVGVVLFVCLLYMPSNDRLAPVTSNCRAYAEELHRRQINLLAVALQAKSDLVALQAQLGQWQTRLKERDTH
jgi:hypothetical protein